MACADDSLREETRHVSVKRLQRIYDGGENTSAGNGEVALVDQMNRLRISETNR